MRVGVIRNDLAQAIFLADLEPVSRYNPAIEPSGQEQYLKFPESTSVTALLLDSTVGAGAVAEGGDINAGFPLTITGSSNDVLRLSTTIGGSFTNYTLAAGAVADLDALLDVINAAIAGSGITARAGVGSGDRVALEGPRGTASQVAIDTTGNGSSANADLGFSTSGVERSMPGASDTLAVLSPPGGPLAIEDTDIDGIGSGSNANALSLIPKTRGTHDALRDVVAPAFAETSVAIESYLVGQIAGYRNSSFNPDSRRVPALTPGAAVAVVADDGSAFSTNVTVPTITSATLDSPNAGDVTIAGTGLGGELGGGGGTGRLDTEVKFTGVISVKLGQKQIENAGGSVSLTAIVVPASLIPGATTTTTSVQVMVRQRLSGVEAVA